VELAVVSANHPHRVPIAWQIRAVGRSLRPGAKPGPGTQRIARYVEKFGAPLALSSTAEAARALVTRTARSRSFAASLRRLRGLIDWDDVSDLSPAGVARDARPWIAEPAASAMQRGVECELASLAALLNLQRFHGPVEAPARAGRPEHDDHLAFAYDPSLPLTVVETYLAAYDAQAAIFGLLWAIENERAPIQEVSAALGEAYESGMRGYLRLLASIPGSGVSADLVPQAQRHDLEELRRQHEGFWSGVAEGRADFGVPDDDG
jgi:hypothetical protein